MHHVKKTDVVIVDDHRVLADALAQALSTDHRLMIHGLFTDPHDCLDALAGGASIDIIISDYSMPSMNGIDLLTKAKQIRPEIRCVLLTMHDEVELRFRSRRAGIEGYLPKTSSISEILEHLQAIVMGQVNDEDDWQGSHKIIDHVELTPSEIEVIRCVVCRELSSKAAAEYLHRSHHTVEQHRKNIYAKLGIDSVAALTKYAIAAGICSRITAEQR